MRSLDWYLVGAIILSVLILDVTYTHKARAQDHTGHDLYHDNAYSKWQKPNGVGSCCNLRVLSLDGKTRVKGDCYPTEAKPILDKDGYQTGWIALKDDGSWVPIPESTLLRRTINPDDSGVSAHLCESYGDIHCFLPPAGVM